MYLTIAPVQKGGVVRGRVIFKSQPGGLLRGELIEVLRYSISENRLGDLIGTKHSGLIS